MGEENEEGKFPEGTFNHAVAQNLDKYAETVARAAKLAQQSGLTDDN